MLVTVVMFAESKDQKVGATAFKNDFNLPPRRMTKSLDFKAGAFTRPLLRLNFGALGLAPHERARLLRLVKYLVAHST